MSRDLIVTRLSGALALLAQAKDATDAKQVADVAWAAEVYANRQRLSEDAIAYATAVKVDALTLMGEFLATAPKHPGARGVGPIAVPRGNRNPPPTLKELEVLAHRSCCE
jgi:hypothetical protein